MNNEKKSRSLDFVDAAKLILLVDVRGEDFRAESPHEDMRANFLIMTARGVGCSGSADRAVVEGDQKKPHPSFFARKQACAGAPFEAQGKQGAAPGGDEYVRGGNSFRAKTALVMTT